jgi:GNAT superfamily N-acetyltransferase
MLIRRMIKADIPALAQLYKQFWQEDSCIEAMDDEFARLGANEAYVLLCAVENGKLIGSVMGVVCGELYGNCQPFMLLENMVVDSGCRNRGAGKALIIELEEIARGKNCSQILLVTENDRADACAFYTSAGFDPDTHRGFKKKLNAGR